MSKPSRPAVSVGMPVYQEGSRLRATIESVLAQEFEDFELILADNASTDETPEICARAAREDRRVRFLENRRNVGSRRNFNRVFDVSRGACFVWMRGHDLWHPAYLARCHEVLMASERTVLCHARALEVDEHGRRLGPMAETIDTRGQPLEQRLAAVWRSVVGPATLGLVRSEAMDRTHLYQEVDGCDVVFLAELATLGEFAFVDEPLLTLTRTRTELDEEETRRRTYLQLDPFRAERRHVPPPDVLDFFDALLRIVDELAVDRASRGVLVAELVSTFRRRFSGSLRRAVASLARFAIDEALAPRSETARSLPAGGLEEVACGAARAIHRLCLAALLGVEAHGVPHAVRRLLSACFDDLERGSPRELQVESPGA